MLNQPTSSPMMTRILGLPDCCAWAAPTIAPVLSADAAATVVPASSKLRRLSMLFCSASDFLPDIGRSCLMMRKDLRKTRALRRCATEHGHDFEGSKDGRGRRKCLGIDRPIPMYAAHF